MSTPLVSSRRLRDGTSIGFAYDHLGRLTDRDTPNTAFADFDSVYAYDNLGRPTSLAATTGTYVNLTYDALGRVTAQTINAGTYAFQYDAAGRMTRMTWPDSFYVTYDYDDAGELLHVRENGATSDPGVLATYTWDDRGRRTSLRRGNGLVTGYAYDAVDRLTQIDQDFGGTTYDLTLTDSYDPAGGIASHTQSNDAYAWGDHYAVNRSYTTNGLNQYSAAGSATLTYDGRGNLASDGTRSFTHTAENRLAQMGSSVLLSHDAAGWLSQVVGSVNTLFDAPGGTIVSERDGYYALLRRYVHGAGGEPLVWYEGTGTSARHWLHADERGSVIALSNDAGTLTNVNSYDEYGIPGAANAGRFQYTGQAWLGDLGMYYFRNRIYSPTLGRFLQTDPIGHGGGMNLYAYVGGDPINFSDPMGLARICVQVHDSAGPGLHSKCIDVDGNNNGIGTDDDMSQDLIDAFRDSYGGFIAQFGGDPLHPLDLTYYGRNAVGGNEHDRQIARIVSQFIGYIAENASTSDGNVTATRFRTFWDHVTEIRADNQPGHAAASELMTASNNSPGHPAYYIQIWGGWMYDSLPDLARAMLHEPWHELWPGDMNHGTIDWWARTMTVRMGLGRCHATGGFPGC